MEEVGLLLEPKEGGVEPPLLRVCAEEFGNGKGEQKGRRKSPRRFRDFN